MSDRSEDHRVSGLVARYFPGSGSQLAIDGLSIGELVERFATPLYVYDTSVIDQKLGELRRALPSGFSIHYSVKANPNLELIRHFLTRGCGLEVASAGEIMRALAAGCPPEDMLFAGPGKTDAEIELALTRGLGEIHVESALEADRLGGIARRLGVRARVALRVNPASDVQGGAMRMGGKPSPFGVDEERIDSVVDRLEADPFVELRGLHLFTGTQILDHSVLVAQYRRGLDIAQRVAGRLGRALHTLDFGGGLGIPYFANEAELDMVKLREELGALMTSISALPLLQGTRFVVEPGRYLVGDCGVYVARVIDKKTSRGKTFLVVDGGMNHHLAASGNLGQVIKRNFPVALLNRMDEAPIGPVDVVGPLCTPLDTLARDVRLPAAEVGDLFGVFQSGAYGLSASPTEFLSHAVPAEVLVCRGEARLIRSREGSGQAATPA